MEISSVAILFAGLLTLNSRAADLVGQYASVSRAAFLQLRVRDERPDAVLALAGSLIWSCAAAIAPLVLAAMATAIVINLVQVGPLLSLEAVKPNLGKLNPVEGLKRMWSGRALVELAKSALKLSVTAFVAYQVIRERYSELVALQAASALGALGTVGGIILEVGVKCGLAMLVMAAGDYAYQRRSLENSLKMSREDIKEEFRQSEGDPHVKGKLRQMAKQFASRRMMQRVPHADVVITNPVHLAVALEYKPPRMQAPVVIAKGQLLVAEQIKRVAREHGVPVIENRPLAQALYRSVDIGMAIPPALYQAVAEVLAFIYRLRDEREVSEVQWRT